MKRPEPVIGSAKPEPGPVDFGIVPSKNTPQAIGSRALLAAQLRTGQYFEGPRAEWLARHGGDA